jgi:hypothetical protein
MRDPPLIISDLLSAQFFGSLQPLPPGGRPSALCLIRNQMFLLFSCEETLKLSGDLMEFDDFNKKAT